MPFPDIMNGNNGILKSGLPMSQTPQELNLARKLRPQNFDEVIGQVLSIQLLKNSLMRNTFFPVYLFSGQRGCGKTSTARIFAAAVNCQKLPEFQKDASLPFPCAQCSSCTSTRSGNHPDFIEIDAASNTGVDNVRSILETCSYMPLLGRKKIYLIDEAHMLSKSAFNAFLKMLEEPPASVIFILATTEALKIPDTVRSRCFQLLFKALPPQEMKSYIQEVCAKESIDLHQEALAVLMHEVDGCMRDALNLLEQLRFLGTAIDEKTVLTALGLVSKQHLYTLFKIILAQDVVQLLTHLDAMKFVTITPAILWGSLLQLCRTILWKKYGVASNSVFAAHDAAQIEALSAACSLDRLQVVLQQLWAQEEFFLKTPQKHMFLEYMLVQLCLPHGMVQQVQVQQITQNAEPVYLKSSQIQEEAPITSVVPTGFKKRVQEPDVGVQPKLEPTVIKVVGISSEPFRALVEQIGNLGDRLLYAIFTQAQFLGIDSERKYLRLGLTSVSSFYLDKVRETQALWQPILISLFPDCNDFVMEALPRGADSGLDSRQKTHGMSASASTSKGFGAKGGPATAAPDISDTQKWAQANLLTQQFSGKLELIKDESE